jgi:hypothetical protein
MTNERRNKMNIKIIVLGSMMALTSFFASANDVSVLCPDCNPRNASDSVTISKALSYANSGLNNLVPGNTIDIERDTKQPNGNIFEAVRTYSIIRLPANSIADLTDLGFQSDVNDIGHPRKAASGGYGITYDNAYACFFSFEFC